MTAHDMLNNQKFHVAVIPDGNRRWAKERGLEPWKGHEEGAKTIEKLIRSAHESGVTHLSFWGSSADNLQKRPVQEKIALLRIYEEYFERLKTNSDIHEKKTRICVLGLWRQQFPESICTLIDDCISMTKDYDERVLTFFLAYNGDEEMLSAVKSIVASGVSSDAVTGVMIKEHLYTHDLPAVDLLVRTGGEPHLSAGFMMWDVANSQLFFSDKYFPDFDSSDFVEAIDEYHRRTRRLGQ
ncbi:MAG: di-trans,poly-cis-decaprenylcistransferase [Candidatus Moranbacteria bacterium]|nr:di-trans,poly-cis-decaprenylcistransferase [Candidatus Moranbacteria bacterium]